MMVAERELLKIVILSSSVKDKKTTLTNEDIEKVIRQLRNSYKVDKRRENVGWRVRFRHVDCKLSPRASLFCVSPFVKEGSLS